MKPPEWCTALNLGEREPGQAWAANQWNPQNEAQLQRDDGCDESGGNRSWNHIRLTRIWVQLNLHLLETCQITAGVSDQLPTTDVFEEKRLLYTGPVNETVKLKRRDSGPVNQTVKLKQQDSGPVNQTAKLKRETDRQLLITLPRIQTVVPPPWWALSSPAPPSNHPEGLGFGSEG